MSDQADLLASLQKEDEDRVVRVIHALDEGIELQGFGGLTWRERTVLAHFARMLIATTPCLCTPMGPDCSSAQDCPVHGRRAR